MNMNFILLMSGGPAVASLALLAYIFPYLRPRRLGITLAVLGAASFIPVLIGYATNSGYPILILRPGTIFIGLLAASAYFVISHRHKLPARHLVAAIAIAAGSIWDGISLSLMMQPSFGSAYCIQTTNQQQDEQADAGNLASLGA